MRSSRMGEFSAPCHHGALILRDRIKRHFQQMRRSAALRAGCAVLETLAVPELEDHHRPNLKAAGCDVRNQAGRFSLG